MTLTVDALDHLVVNVSNAEASAQWYERVLGMTRVVFDPGAGKAPRISMRFGQQKLNLRPVTTGKVEWFTADHETAGSDDLCFLTATPPEAVVTHLKTCGIEIEEGPVKKQGALGTLTSLLPRPGRQPDRNLIIRQITHRRDRLTGIRHISSLQLWQALCKPWEALCKDLK